MVEFFAGFGFDGRMPSNPPLAWNEVFYVYMMSNERWTTLYVGVTNDLEKRLYEHRWRTKPESFTAKYRLNRLVWFERFADVRDAIAREKQIKRWRRSKKEFLINEQNPKWRDLAVTQLGLEPPPKDSEVRNASDLQRHRPT